MRLDRRGLAGEREVEDVAAWARMEPHPVAAAAASAHRASRPAGRRRAGPVLLVHGASVRCTAASPPCSCISCSAASDSVRSSSAGRARPTPHLALLLVGQRQDPQRQDLVDLGAVEQVAGLSGAISRIVVEDDRRGEHRVALPPRRPPAPARRRCSRSRRPARASASGGSSSETNSPPATREDGVRRDQRAEQQRRPGPRRRRGVRPACGW